MKKLLSVLLVISLIFVSGCGNTPSEGPVLPEVTAARENSAVSEQSAAEATAEVPQSTEEPSADSTEEAVTEDSSEEADPQQAAYEQAIELAQSEDYVGAVAALRNITDYQDAAMLLKEFAYEAVRSYIRTNGSAFALTEEEFRDSFDSYDHAVAIPYNDVAKIIMALDENDNLVFSLLNESGYRDDSGSLGTYMCEDFNLVLKQDLNTADYQIMSLTILLGAYTLESGNGSMDITEYTTDTELTAENLYQKIRTIQGEETEKSNITLDDMNLIPTMLRTANERLFPTIENQLAELGICLNDLGFTSMPAYAANETDSAEASTESTAQPSTGGVSGNIDVTKTTGRAVFKDWYFAPDGFLADEAYDPNNTLIVDIDYTNLEDDAKTVSQDFWVRAYQNGVELDSSFCSYHPDVVESVDNKNKTVLKDGTITTGWWFYLNDNSPVTIVVKNNGGKEEAEGSMTIDIDSDGTRADVSTPDDTAADSVGTVDQKIDAGMSTGHVTYNSCKYASADFLADDAYDPARTLIINFDYTNLEDEGKEMSQDFWVRAYQNGVELDHSFCSYHPDVEKTADNAFKTVLKDGTITVGWWYYLEDDSPVTVIVKNNGGSESFSETMVITLE